jgi:LuxR family maltose regulon positive regulatory protein
VTSRSVATAGVQTEALEPVPDSLPVELFEAKLLRPAHPHAQVSRARILKRLLAAPNASVVTVFAAPGSGKTSLLTQWVDSDERAYAWLSLDERDNDPTVLFTYLAVALAQIGDLDPQVFAALRSSVPEIEARVVPRIVKSVTAMDQPLILVLDDAHLIHEQSCLDALATLILRLPPSMQIAIAGRMEPAIHLPRLRAEGEVLDIGAQDLAFTEDETRELLRLVGIPMSDDEISDLVVRTEGWPVGIYLAALSMRAGRFRPGRRVVSGADRYVGDYLRSEFLDQLSPRTTTFLTRAAALDPMSGPLCDSILHRRDSARTLDSLSRENMLVTPQDSEGKRYRYHPLFRELLLADLEKREPGRTEILQLEAARWYEARGEPETALDYAQSAGDTDHAARLFSLVAIKAFRHGRMATVAQWLEWFLDRDLEKEYPLVALVGAWFKTLVGEAEIATVLTTVADEGLTDELLFDGVTSARSWVSLLKALACADGVNNMERNARDALASMPEVGSQRGAALFVVGAAKLLRGDHDAAESYLLETVEVGSRIKATH